MAKYLTICKEDAENQWCPVLAVYCASLVPLYFSWPLAPLHDSVPLSGSGSRPLAEIISS